MNSTYEDSGYISEEGNYWWRPYNKCVRDSKLF